MRAGCEDQGAQGGRDDSVICGAHMLSKPLAFFILTGKMGVGGWEQEGAAGVAKTGARNHKSFLREFLNNRSYST